MKIKAVKHGSVLCRRDKFEGFARTSMSDFWKDEDTVEIDLDQFKALLKLSNPTNAPMHMDMLMECLEKYLHKVLD
jgi:hypothetical protein